MLDKETIDQLRDKFNEIVNSPPFNGTVTHRTRAIFLSRWKEYLASQNIRGPFYVDDLLRALKTQRKIG